MGLGCFTCRQTIAIRQTLVTMAMLLLFMAIPAIREILGRASELLSLLGHFLIWEKAVRHEACFHHRAHRPGPGKLRTWCLSRSSTCSCQSAVHSADSWRIIRRPSSFVHSPPFPWFAIVCGLDCDLRRVGTLGPANERCFARCADGCCVVRRARARRIGGSLVAVSKAPLRMPTEARQIGDYIITVNNGAR